MSRLTLKRLVSLIADELGIDEHEIYHDIETREDMGMFPEDVLTPTEWGLIIYTVVALGAKRSTALDYAQDVVDKLTTALRE